MEVVLLLAEEDLGGAGVVRIEYDEFDPCKLRKLADAFRGAAEGGGLAERPGVVAILVLPDHAGELGRLQRLVAEAAERALLRGAGVEPEG